MEHRIATGEPAAQALRLPGLRDHRRAPGHQWDGHSLRAHRRGRRGGAEAQAHHAEGHPVEFAAQRATCHLAMPGVLQLAEAPMVLGSPPDFWGNLGDGLIFWSVMLLGVGICWGVVGFSRASLVDVGSRGLIPAGGEQLCFREVLEGLRFSLVWDTTKFLILNVKWCQMWY